MEKLLKVGAATQEILFPQEMFPMPPSEKYSGVHDNPLLHVVIFEHQETFVFLAIDLCDLGDKKAIRRVLTQELGIPEERQVIHSSHTLASPHCRRNEEATTPGLKGKNDLMVHCILEAVRLAAKTAKATLQPAKCGFGMGYTAINVNRDVETDAGWWMGVNDEGPTDHSMPVIRIDDVSGNPIVIFYVPNCAASSQQECFLSDGSRLVSGDIASASSRIIEKAYGGKTVAIYCTGVSGDQWQYLRSQHSIVGPDGKLIVTDLKEAIYPITELLAGRLAQSVFKAVNAIECKEFDGNIELSERSYDYPGHTPDRGENEGPVREMNFLPAPDAHMTASVLKLGKDTAVLCIGVEVTVDFLQYIRSASPFKHTIVLEFAATGMGYLVEKKYYDRFMYQSRKSPYAMGSGERFRVDMLDLLNAAKDCTV